MSTNVLAGRGVVRDIGRSLEALDADLAASPAFAACEAVNATGRLALRR